MKYAVTDSRTFENLYANHTPNRWIWAEFFFSERGTKTQRTLEGLLHRILYQLLSQAADLLPFFADIYKNSAEIQGQWLLTYLERTLINIAEQRRIHVNICLFIDALDENSEDYDRTHWRLLEILQRFMNKADGRVVKIMLCLSSRPENLFKDFFKGSPSFQVHLKTNFDIQTYVHGRINTYLMSRDDLSSNAEAIAFLTGICTEIVRRAQGVFLWVRVVTTYLIEGLIDGESPEDLKQVLSSIQGDGDLYQLYNRIMERLKPVHLREAFVMLQIAYAATEPWPVTEFFEAVGYIYSNVQRLNPNAKVLSEPEMERRLFSRCRGFLELKDSAVQAIYPGTAHASGGKVVLFLHRTVREFLANSRSFEILRSRLQSRLLGNGHVFITKFRIEQHLRCFAINPNSVQSLKDNQGGRCELFYQARMAEETDGHPVTEHLDILSEFIDSHDLASTYINMLDMPYTARIPFIALAIRAGLLLYVEEVLRRRGVRRRPKSSSDTKCNGIRNHALDGGMLHYAIPPVKRGATRYAPSVTTPEMIQLLVDWGADLEEFFGGVTPFGAAFAHYTKESTLRPEHQRILEHLLEIGADPSALALNATSRQGSTRPLQLAVRKNNYDLTKLLLSHGAKTVYLDKAEWRYMEKHDKQMLLLVNRYHEAAGEA